MLESLIADIYMPVQVVPWYAIFCSLKVIMSVIRLIFLSRKYMRLSLDYIIKLKNKSK